VTIPGGIASLAEVANGVNQTVAGGIGNISVKLAVTGAVGSAGQTVAHDGLGVTIAVGRQSAPAAAMGAATADRLPTDRRHPQTQRAPRSHARRC
jgi:hypothetical protein